MNKKILIVDDDPDAVLFLSTVLEDNGYTTLKAANGKEGLEKARSEPPDLILLDLMMPQKSGIALLSDMQAENSLRAIPVIMVTGVSGETGIDLESFFKSSPAAAGDDAPPRPDGYLEKPVDPQKLLRLVESVFE